MSVILASASPRRQKLLKLLFGDFKIIPPDIKERLDRSLAPWDLAMSLAAQKANAVKNSMSSEILSSDIVIGADTIVASHEKILGKPENEQEAAEMLRFLSGDTHRVYTGICILTQGEEERFFAETKVWFYELSKREIDRYIATGEPVDKAGAYAIQGHGAKFIKKIDGDFYNVVGLPVSAVYNKIKELQEQRQMFK